MHIDMNVLLTVRETGAQVCFRHAVKRAVRRQDIRVSINDDYVCCVDCLAEEPDI